MKSSIVLWRDVCVLAKQLRQLLALNSPPDPQSADQICQRLFPFTSVVSPTFPPANGLVALPVKQAGPANSLNLAQTYKTGLLGKKKNIWWLPAGQNQHALVVATVGAGKTETLLSLAHESRSNGQSVLYVDGKGDNSLYAKTLSLLSKSGRVGSFRVINLMTGSRAPDRKSSHSIDLFSGMSASDLAKWLEFTWPLTQCSESIAQQVRALLPHLAALAHAFSASTQKPLLPQHVGRLLTESGIMELSYELEGQYGHLAKQVYARVWGGNNAPLAQEFARFYQMLSLLWVSYDYIFASTAPECRMSDLTTPGGAYILVLGPAMERSTDDLCVVMSALLGAFRVSRKGINSGSEPTNVNTLAIIDEFPHFMRLDQLKSLNSLRGGDLGVVWGCSDHGRLKLYDWIQSGVSPPGTTILMKLESSELIDPFLQWQHKYFPTHPQVEKKISFDFREGQALLWDHASKFHGQMMYHSAPRLAEVFLTQPVAKTMTPSEFPPAHLSRLVSEDPTRVLQDRLKQWQKSSTPDAIPPLSWCQETVARMLGFSNWHEASQIMKPKQ